MLNLPLQCSCVNTPHRSESGGCSKIDLKGTLGQSSKGETVSLFMKGGKGGKGFKRRVLSSLQRARIPGEIQLHKRPIKV